MNTLGFWKKHDERLSSAYELRAISYELLLPSALCAMFTPRAPLNRVPSGCSTGVECEAYSSGAGPIALGPYACPVEPGTLRVFNWGAMLYAPCFLGITT
ncbi:unnamed protein product [marine sediment metagenome]|uniref:Uncharacterized protein n=1 Tax=marine sediment metagenome TaxID=412755 RepID=X0SF55_9ZZZZ